MSDQNPFRSYGYEVDPEAERILGPAGLLISYSKRGYRERHPDHVAVFNANVCRKDAKLWHGDVVLTRDEPKLAALAAELGEIVYLLYEADGRFENAVEPLLERALYSVTPDGHTRFRHEWIERDRDGTLRHRPPPPETRRRLALVLGRPRLWRFWKAERRAPSESCAETGRTTLLYLGERRSETRGPLLVLGLSRTRQPLRQLGLEWTWYPTPKRHAPRPLLSISLRRRHGRLRPWLHILIHPGHEYELLLGLARGREG